MEERELIARRAARFLADGDLVNLGIGLPGLVVKYIPKDVDVWIDTENGAIGLAGPPEPGQGDPDIVDAAGKQTTLRTGSCCFDSFTSFGLIRGGHVTTAILGAYEVDQEGNLANWTVPGKTTAGMGGAMDLAAGTRQILVTMTHTNKEGEPKILKKCSLPLTAVRKVNYIITELCVLQVTPEGLVLLEVAPGVTVDEVQAKTQAQLIIPETVGCMV